MKLTRLNTGFLAVLLTMSCQIAHSASLEEKAPNTGTIQVVPVDPTPDPDHVETTILYPKEKELRTSAPVKGQIKLEGFALGTDTEQPRKKKKKRNLERFFGTESSCLYR